MGKRRPELKAKLPGGFSLGSGQHLQFGGSTISVGPCRAANFPWILLDRAIGVFCYLVNRSHARRDDATLDASQLKAVLEQHQASSSGWDDENGKLAKRYLKP